MESQVYADYNVVCLNSINYSTAREQINVLTRVGTRNMAHEHANLSHT